MSTDDHTSYVINKIVEARADLGLPIDETAIARELLGAGMTAREIVTHLTAQEKVDADTTNARCCEPPQSP